MARCGISNDLTDIYLDLQNELKSDAVSGEEDAERLWSWRFAFVQHWGKFHLPSALQAIAWLVYQHWDEDDEKWDDAFLSQRRPGHS